MSHNLANLNPDEKNRIELDKQASYLVWQIKQAKVGQEAIIRRLDRLTSEQEKTWFEQSVTVYKKLMGVS